MNRDQAGLKEIYDESSFVFKPCAITECILYHEGLCTAPLHGLDNMTCTATSADDLIEIPEGEWVLRGEES